MLVLDSRDSTNDALRFYTGFVLSLCSFGFVILAACTTDNEKSDGDLTSVSSGQGDRRQRSKLQDQFKHPRAATEWETRVLFLTSKTPPANDMADCEQEVFAIAKEATNEESLLQVLGGLQTSVNGNTERYHWCFYRMMRSLDIRLSYFGKTLGQRSELFFVGMRSLWVLARSLDKERKVNFYFRFLRARYRQISAKIFGRHVDVIGGPLGVFSGKPGSQNLNKVAGPAGID